ncbi:MAG TPA: GPW/gp25 family protein [Roseiflexaceae bacterium]|nr:GPW/gp25 family protein [Roseiflexaceae bacterium]
MERTRDLIGAGWSFPIRVDERGGIAVARGADDIEQAIRLILSTPIGQRLMRPTFGCRIHELLFAPMNASTFTAARHYVAEALGMWEPRIDVLDIRCEAADAGWGAAMLVFIQYRVRQTHDERSLVWPFYTIPDE